MTFEDGFDDSEITPALYHCVNCGFLSTARNAFTRIKGKLYCDYCKPKR
jgi:hypothetical protein